MHDYRMMMFTFFNAKPFMQRETRDTFLLLYIKQDYCKKVEVRTRGKKHFSAILLNLYAELDVLSFFQVSVKYLQNNLYLMRLSAKIVDTVLN